MAIQQSINQLLSTASWGAALYSHTPQFKENQELNKLKREMDEAEEYKKGSWKAMDQATDQIFISLGAPNPNDYEGGTDSSQFIDDRNKWLDELKEKHGLDDAAMNEIISIQAPMRANIHPSKSWEQMTARRRQLDPEYREQEYQKQIENQMKGKNKTIEALQKLFAGKIDAEGFKEQVYKKENEQPIKKSKGKGKVKKNGK